MSQCPLCRAGIPRLPRGPWEGEPWPVCRCGLQLGHPGECQTENTRTFFPYFCGVCRNKVAAISDRARQIMDESEPNDGA